MIIKCKKCNKETHHTTIQPGLLTLIGKLFGEGFYDLIKVNTKCFECGFESYVESDE